MLINKNIKLVLYLRANSAKVGPPLGTTLGNIGVNTAKFVKEFNDFTKELPNYFLLKVIIFVSENKNFTFTIELPSIGFFCSLLKKEEKYKDKNGTMQTFVYITLDDFIKLAKFKFPTYNLEKALRIIKGSLLNSKINIK
jgi:ribosomal protein L11